MLFLSCLSTAALLLVIVSAGSPDCPNYHLDCAPVRDVVVDVSSGDNSKLPTLLSKYTDAIQGLYSSNATDATCCFNEEIRRCLLVTGKEKGVLPSVQAKMGGLDLGFFKNRIAGRNCTMPDIGPMVAGLNSAAHSGFCIVMTLFAANLVL